MAASSRQISSDSVVEKIALSFFSQQSAKDIEGVDILSWDQQKKLLDITINGKLLKQFPMNKKFCRSFFKELIANLEKSVEVEVHDDLYKFYCEFLQNTSDEHFSYRHYVVDDNITQIISIKESSSLISDGTTGLRTWEAGLALADWAISNKELFKEKNILELGSGMGLTGIAISKFCEVSSIAFSDCHAKILKNLSNNICINFQKFLKREDIDKTQFTEDKLNIDILNIDWHKFNPESLTTIPDVIIGADVVFDPTLFGPLSKVFIQLYTLNNNVKIILMSTIRNEDTNKAFLQRLGEDGFNTKVEVFNKPKHFRWDPSKMYQLLEIIKK